MENFSLISAVLEIQFHFLKYMAVARMRKHFEQLCVLTQAMQAITVWRCKQTTSKS